MKHIFALELMRKIFQVVLGMALVFAGLAHLTFSRDTFHAQVPTYLYSIEGPLIFVTGIIEILLGVALMFLWKYRTHLGWITAFYLLIITAGNFAQFRQGIDAFGLDSDRARFIRLLFQPLLILWALWATEAWKSYRAKTK